MEEIKLDLNLQIRETIEQVISEQVLETIRDSIDELRAGVRTNFDLASSMRHRSPEVNISQRVWGKTLHLNRNAGNQNRHYKKNSSDPQSSNDDYDNFRSSYDPGKEIGHLRRIARNSRSVSRTLSFVIFGF